MNSDISRAAQKVPRLKEQAEKLSAPPADAEAELRAAEEAEAARRHERRAVYERQTLDTWREEAAKTAEAAREPMLRFRELLAQEPWAIAWAEARAARFNRQKIHTEAQNAAAFLGEDMSPIPELRWVDPSLMDDVLSVVEEIAAGMSVEFANRRRAEKEEFINGQG